MKRPLNVAGWFWLAYLVLLIAAISCGVVH